MRFVNLGKAKKKLLICELPASFMDINLLTLINDIKISDTSVMYSSFRNLFDFVNAPFCKFQVMVGHKLLYRVRSHTKDDGNYHFNNIHELSYRQDRTNIRKFGRCNEPIQSRFYASDDETIAFTEVSEIVRTENKKDTAYYTTSAWKFNQNVLVTPIFEPDNIDIENQGLVDITKKCFEIIETSPQIREEDKKELKSFLKGMAKEFTKPSSVDNNAYLLSAAYSNFLFDTIGYENEKIDGIVYPTCIDKTTTRSLGLNYVFNNSIIGFDNKIEFIGAYRSRLEKKNIEYYETERIKNKSFDKLTGEIVW